MEYLSQRKFAMLAGVSNSAVIRARKEGRVYRSERGYDPGHPTNKYYLENAQGRQSEESRAKKKEKAKPREKPKPKPIPKQPGVNISADDLPSMPIELKNGNSDNSEMQDVLKRITKTDADTWKRIEEIKKLEQSRLERRGELIPKSEVQRIFNKLYLVDANELKTMGDRLAPEVAALCSIDDPELVMKINNLCEREAYKILKRVKRQMEIFIGKMESELKGEQKEITEDEG